jgi:hypothetical protein
MIVLLPTRSSTASSLLGLGEPLREARSFQLDALHAQGLQHGEALAIPADDIGAFVALAFERPKEFIREAREIAGSQLTNCEADEKMNFVVYHSALRARTA